MASADEDNQDQVGAELLSGASQNDEEDIKAVFASGLRVMMGSFLLDRLLMALSMTIIKKNTNPKNNVLNCEDVQRFLNEAIEEGYSAYRKMSPIQIKLLNMLKDLENYQHATSDGLKKQLTNATVQNKSDVHEFRRKSTYVGSVLLDNAFNYAEGGKNIDVRVACLKLKMGYVHEICSSQKIGWKLCVDADKKGQLFKDVSRLKDAQGRSLDGYQLIQLLHKCRNDAAHHHDLDKEEGDIEEFQQQFDAVVDLLKPYFEDESSQTSVRYHFPEVTTVFTEDMLNTRLRSCRETLLKVLKRSSLLVSDVASSKKKEKDNQIWSVIVAYHDGNQSMAEDDAVYHQLFGLIENPEQFSQTLGEDDSKPRKDLESLVRERKLGKNSCHDPLTPTVVGDEEAENRDVTSGTAQPADIDVEEKDAEKEVVE